MKAGHRILHSTLGFARHHTSTAATRPIQRAEGQRQQGRGSARAAGPITGDGHGISDDRGAVHVAVPVPRGSLAVDDGQDAVPELGLTASRPRST